MNAPAGRIRSVHLALLVALLVAPGIAALRLASHGALWFPVAWATLASGLTYLLYAIDKRRAQSRGGRLPEAVLHLGELAGGWPGAFLAQQWVRHKSSKFRFQFVYWLIVALHQFVAVDSLLGWRLARTAWSTVAGPR